MNTDDAIKVFIYNKGRWQQKYFSLLCFQPTNQWIPIFYWPWGRTLSCTQWIELSAANWENSWKTGGGEHLNIQTTVLFFCKNHNKQRRWALWTNNSQTLNYALHFTEFYNMWCWVRFWFFFFQVNKIICFKNVMAKNFECFFLRMLGNYVLTMLSLNIFRMFLKNVKLSFERIFWEQKQNYPLKHCKNVTAYCFNNVVTKQF